MARTGGGEPGAAWSACPGRRLEARGLSPLLEPLGADLTELLGGEPMATRAEVVADGAEGFQEPLGVLG